jgi:hypothetical protein
MFLYSFLAMTSYNIIQPITRSKFISEPRRREPALGPVRLGPDHRRPDAGLREGHGAAAAPLGDPGDSQAAIVVAARRLLVLFQTGDEWVSAGFYLLGLIFGSCSSASSGRWPTTIYDARQAKRIFGFIGGGTASLGGMMGAGITTLSPSASAPTTCSSGARSSSSCASPSSGSSSGARRTRRRADRRRGGEASAAARRSACCHLPPPAASSPR